MAQSQRMSEIVMQHRHRHRKGYASMPTYKNRQLDQNAMKSMKSLMIPGKEGMPQYATHKDQQLDQNVNESLVKGLVLSEKGIFSLFTNLKAKESCNWWLTRSILGFRQQKSDVKYLPMSVSNIGMLHEPFRKRKWCLRDFADTQEGLRNHFATKSYSRRAAKLASILRFSASSLRHISGNFRRKYTLLYKKAAKSLCNKRVISQHFAKCFLQLGVISLQWLQPFRFNSKLCTV
uniref:Uncharacterized protein n=1 Tax=Vitis vinifera TaxID=29760 RepID=A5BD88_VITVI|nr:hypothetical protein VITISV_034185 [Vitis vinifera]